MYAIYANIWGIVMVKYGIHVTIYTIHGSYGYWVPQLSTALLRGKESQNFHPSGFASRAAPCWANFPGTNDDPQFCRVLIGSPFQHHWTILLRIPHSQPLVAQCHGVHLEFGGADPKRMCLWNGQPEQNIIT